MSFTARYEARCTAEDCPTGVIEVGDEIEPAEGLPYSYFHAACASRQRRRQPPLCGKCNTHHRGECW